MKRSVFIRSFAILLIFCIFCSILSGCAPGSKSSSSEPPVYSPLRVLVPEAPGSDTLGSSPLTLDVSNITQGYFVAQSDSADLVTSLQITAPTGVLYAYFIDPGENAVIPFTEGNGDYTVVGYQQIQGDQYAALYSEILTVELENDSVSLSKSICKLLARQRSKQTCTVHGFRRYHRCRCTEADL